MTTAKGVSTVTTADIALTFIAFILVYTIIGAVDAWLFVRAARLGLDGTGEEAEGAELAGLVY
jgi:cytochrome bd-type quinol oxidase subunit 1